jgi:hypothetical protein
VGLERVFNEIFPISDVNGNFSLEFVRYGLGEPKYDMEECMERDMTYAAPLEGDAPPDRVGERRRGAPAEGHHREGSLPRGSAAADAAGHVHHQRRGARDRLAAPPLAGCRVRGDDPPERLQAVQRPDHPVPRLVGRVHGRHPRRGVGAHRQEEEVPGLRAAARGGVQPRRDVLSLFFPRETVALATLERRRSARAARRGVPRLPGRGRGRPGLARAGDGADSSATWCSPGPARCSSAAPAHGGGVRGDPRGGPLVVPVAPAPGGACGRRAEQRRCRPAAARRPREVAVFRPGTSAARRCARRSAKDPTRGTLDALFAIHNLLRPGTAPAPDVWTEDEFEQSGGPGDAHRRLPSPLDGRGEPAGGAGSREAQRSTEDRMLRFAQERGIKYVWESFREERTEKAGAPAGACWSTT